MGLTTATTVKLHAALYSEAAITEAAALFADFASFAVHRDGPHYVVEVTGIKDEIDGDVVGEFCNFALANTAARTRNNPA